jgi:hypothetical protein
VDVAQDRQCVIDSLPIPEIQFYLVPSSTGDWQAYEARYGKVPSKQEAIFGYKLHLLITISGVILDFELAPANATDLEVGLEILSEHTDLEVLGDKAYISASKAAQLWRQDRLRLRTIPRRNQKKQLSPYWKHVYNAIRQIIETVNGQLSEQFNIEKNHAHTLFIYINCLLGKPEFLQNKALAFTISHKTIVV